MMLQRLYRFTNCSKFLQTAVVRNIYSTYKKEYNIQNIGKLSMISSLTAMGTWGLIKSKSNEEKKTESTTSKTMKELLNEADSLFDRGDYKGIYDLLSNYKDDKNVEILWRLSRAIYWMSETANDIEARKLTYEGYDLLCTALNIKEDHFAVHKWMSILLNKKSTLEGTKTLIKESYNIKKHMLRSMELNPDAMIFHMIGFWCYEISSLPWYQRKIASIIFEVPPVSSFEEALMYLEKAEEIDPNFYSHNLLLLGKTYLKLNRKEDAIKYLKKAVEYPAKNDDDQKAKQEAQKILNNI